MNKKHAIVIGISGAVAAFAATSALADITPAGNFTANGVTTLGSPLGSYTCEVTLNGDAGSSNPDDLQINSGSIDPDPNTPADAAICTALSLANLPYSGAALSQTQLQVNGVQVNLGGTLVCAPTTIMPSYSNSSNSVIFNNTSIGNCTVNGSLATTPPLTIQ